MPNSNRHWPILSLHELIREPAQLARSPLPRALSIRTLGRICPLEMPGRGLNDRVHLIAPPKEPALDRRRDGLVSAWRQSCLKFYAAQLCRKLDFSGARGAEVI